MTSLAFFKEKHWTTLEESKPIFASISPCRLIMMAASEKSGCQCRDFSAAFLVSILVRRVDLRPALHSNTERHCTAQNRTEQHGTARHPTKQHGMALHGPACHDTARHGIAQRSTKQHCARSVQKPNVRLCGIHCACASHVYKVCTPRASNSNNKENDLLHFSETKSEFSRAKLENMKPGQAV